VEGFVKEDVEAVEFEALFVGLELGSHAVQRGQDQSLDLWLDLGFKIHPSGQSEVLDKALLAEYRMCPSLEVLLVQRIVSQMLECAMEVTQLVLLAADAQVERAEDVRLERAERRYEHPLTDVELSPFYPGLESSALEQQRLLDVLLYDPRGHLLDGFKDLHTVVADDNARASADEITGKQLTLSSRRA